MAQGTEVPGGDRTGDAMPHRRTALGGLLVRRHEQPHRGGA
ncbi:hypothetical protein ACWCXK_17900 [Streptomyces sp. NPDC001739]